jgi:Ca-activated chloride channel family protein
MLVTDHSRSMMAEDVDPTRLAAAKRAAHTFLDQLPVAVRVGVTTFSDVPDGTQAPTRDHALVRRMIDAQIADGGTATGDALQVALDTLQREPRGADGRRPPAAIVLLSDGSTTIGRDPVGVAQAAHELKIPIYTVALGTDEGTIDVRKPDGTTVRRPVPPDRETMRELAKISGGKTFSATAGNEVGGVYDRLGSQVATRHEERQITAGFAGAAAILLLAGGLMSLRWFGRLP